MSDLRDIMETVGFQVESTAEWRRRKADEFPNDSHRNLEAAEQLEQLAEEIGALEGSEVHQLIDALLDRSTADGFDWTMWNEDVSAALRSYGVHGGCGNGLEFLEWYRETLEERFKECINDAANDGIESPSLIEQVENDETVKAAKQAYEQAYAKAFAEARKRL